jgi:ubiquitin C-terminal hydrolase
MDLYRLPNILIIQLKRFSYTRLSRDKVRARLTFSRRCCP